MCRALRTLEFVERRSDALLLPDPCPCDPCPLLRRVGAGVRAQILDIVVNVLAGTQAASFTIAPGSPGGTPGTPDTPSSVYDAYTRRRAELLQGDVVCAQNLAQFTKTKLEEASATFGPDVVQQAVAQVHPLLMAQVNEHLARV